MKLDLGKVYRNGITGRMILEACATLSNFTRGIARGGHGQWSRRALQAAGLIKAKTHFTRLDDFESTCRAVDSEAIVKIQDAADVKFRTSEANDKSEKSSVYRNMLGMKALTAQDFHNVADSVANLRKAGFSNVEIWVEQPDGAEQPIVKPLAIHINDIFYRALTASATGAAIAKRGIGDGNSAKSRKSSKATTLALAAA
jgi:hypothetical protein